MSEPSPFFIVGCGRSGTTLLRLMLDAHSQVAVPAESHFVDELIRRWPRFLDGGRVNADAVVTFAGRWLDLMSIPRAEAAARLGALEDVTPSAAVDAIFRVYSNAQGKPRWGDKTPGYVMSMPLLAETFPGARFVHLLRDGRDVTLSYVDQPFGPRNVWEGARFWDQRVRAGRRSGRTLGPERYLELRYEDLVAEPREQLERVCALLDLAFEEGMLHYHERSDQKLPERKERWRGLYQPVASGMRDWRTQMPERDQRAFEAMAGPLLGALGYERRFPTASVGTAARSVFASGSWQLRRAFLAARRATRPVRALLRRESEEAATDPR